MKTLSKNIFAVVSGLAVMLFPQLTLSAEESTEESTASSSGSAAGEAAAARGVRHKGRGAGAQHGAVRRVGRASGDD